MLSYPLPEACDLLASKLSGARQKMADCDDDLDFLREQITVSPAATLSRRPSVTDAPPPNHSAKSEKMEHPWWLTDAEIHGVDPRGGHGPRLQLGRGPAPQGEGLRGLRRRRGLSPSPTSWP